MHNLYTNYVKILDICKRFSSKMVDSKENIPRRGPVPRFSDIEVVALSMKAEAIGIDSENYLFGKLKEYSKNFPNLISRSNIMISNI